MPWLELAAVLTGLLAVTLSVRQKVWTWPVGAVNAVLYGRIFYEQKLYADAGLQGVYFLLSFYGAYQWTRRQGTQSALHVGRIPPKRAWLLGGVALLFAAALTRLLQQTDAARPLWDASLTSASLLAQWLMTKKWLESWAVWVVANLFYVGLFLSQALYLTAALYGVFLILAVLGHLEWRKAWLQDVQSRGQAA